MHRLPPRFNKTRRTANINSLRLHSSQDQDISRPYYTSYYIYSTYSTLISYLNHLSISYISYIDFTINTLRSLVS